MPTPAQLSQYAAYAFSALVVAMSIADRAIAAYKDYAATTPQPDDDARAAKWAGYLDLTHRLVAVFSVKGAAKQ